jgi:hypothetical protein
MVPQHATLSSSSSSSSSSKLKSPCPVSPPCCVEVPHLARDEPQALPASRLTAALKQQLQAQADAKEGLARLQAKQHNSKQSVWQTAASQSADSMAADREARRRQESLQKSARLQQSARVSTAIQAHCAIPATASTQCKHLLANKLSQWKPVH